MDDVFGDDPIVFVIGDKIMTVMPEFIGAETLFIDKVCQFFDVSDFGHPRLRNER